MTVVPLDDRGEDWCEMGEVVRALGEVVGTVGSKKGKVVR